MFLNTAEALKIKGIVDTSSSQESATPSECSSILSPPHQVPVGAAQVPVVPVQVQDLLTIPQPLPLLPPVQQHPAGDLTDLTLLAAAAAEPAAQLDHHRTPVQHGHHSTPVQLDQQSQNNKRRKTAPRKLGTYLLNSSHINRGSYR